MANTKEASKKTYTSQSVVRTYDKDGFKQRAGCLCFKDENKQEILLVSSSKDSSCWVVPAGGIDPGETPIEAAEREVCEEAGAVGSLGNCLGVFQNDKSKSRTYIYSMIVKDLVQPLDEKDRRWFMIKDALCMLDHRPIQRSYIEAAIKNDMANHSTTLVTSSDLGNYITD